MATKSEAKKSGRLAKPAKGEGTSSPAESPDWERDYLRRRITSLEALVEENLGLLQRIAALDAECAALRNIIAEGRTGGDGAAAEPPAPPPQSKPAREAAVTKAAARSSAAAARKEKQLAQERARTIEALLDLSVIEAIERRRQQPKGAVSVILVGEAQYLAGKGPGLARQEVRDILNGMPERAKLTLMAIKPPSSVGEEAETPILREGAETVELLMPAAAEVDYIFTSLAPDIVMNVGPLGPVVDVFRYLPDTLKQAGILNLLHGECGALGEAAEDAGRQALNKVGAALVTSDIERQLLLKLGFEGAITTYVRGVNVPQTKVTGLQGNGTLACILEGAGREAASFIAEITVALDAIGERLVALHEGAGEQENGAFADLQSRRPADLVKSLEEADAVLMPPGTTGLPQALQVAMTMGKVCLLPQDPFGRQALEALPGVRYPVEAAKLVDIIRDFLANREVYSDLAERTALYARKHFRRGDWAKVLNGFLSARLPAKAK